MKKSRCSFLNWLSSTFFSSEFKLWDCIFLSTWGPLNNVIFSWMKKAVSCTNICIFFLNFTSAKTATPPGRDMDILPKEGAGGEVLRKVLLCPGHFRRIWKSGQSSQPNFLLPQLLRIALPISFLLLPSGFLSWDLPVAWKEGLRAPESLSALQSWGPQELSAVATGSHSNTCGEGTRWRVFSWGQSSKANKGTRPALGLGLSQLASLMHQSYFFWD